jgi:hypothetical protein
MDLFRFIIDWFFIEFKNSFLAKFKRQNSIKILLCFIIAISLPNILRKVATIQRG